MTCPTCWWLPDVERQAAKLRRRGADAAAEQLDEAIAVYEEAHLPEPYGPAPRPPIGLACELCGAAMEDVWGPLRAKDDRRFRCVDPGCGFIPSLLDELVALWGTGDPTSRRSACRLARAVTAREGVGVLFGPPG